jgi:hypothetical protein
MQSAKKNMQILNFTLVPAHYSSEPYESLMTTLQAKTERT